MEKRLDIRLILKASGIGAGVMLAVCCVFAAVGIKTPDNSFIPAAGAIAASAAAGISSGAICGRYADNRPILHGLMCSLLLGGLVALLSIPQEHYGTLLSRYAVPVLIVAAPPVFSCVVKPVSNAKRTLKKLRRPR